MDTKLVKKIRNDNGPKESDPLHDYRDKRHEKPKRAFQLEIADRALEGISDDE